jgi:hypothetical protein
MCPQFSLSTGQVDAATNCLLHAHVLSMKDLTHSCCQTTGVQNCMFGRRRIGHMCVTIHVNCPTVAITVHEAVAETVAVAVAVTETETMGSSAKVMER